VIYVTDLKAHTRRLFRRFNNRFPRLASPLRRLLDLGADRWQGKSPKEIFTAFYDGHLWQSDESVSGKGSTVEGTKTLREALPRLFQELGAESILDAPCGDFNWMRAVEWDVSYTGGEIVTALVEELSERYTDDRHRFVELDIINDPLPAADVFFCRDCFIHLTNEQVLDTLRNFARSECRYLMTNTFPSVETNAASQTGAVRRLDLLKSPFDLPEPLHLVEDRLDRPGFKFMGVWSREQLAHLHS
jgi:hypothetical protein